MITEDQIDPGKLADALRNVMIQVMRDRGVTPEDAAWAVYKAADGIAADWQIPANPIKRWAYGAVVLFTAARVRAFVCPFSGQGLPEEAKIPN
jgi:hypothetical protein